MAKNDKPIGAMTVEELEATFLAEDDTPGAQKRIRALIRRVGEAQGRVAELEGVSATVDTQIADAKRLAAEEARAAAVAETEQTWTAKLMAREEDLALARVGITDEDAILLLRRAHERLDPDPAKRPAIADYAKTIREDATKREGLSPTLLAGLGIGATASTSDGAPPVVPRVPPVVASGTTPQPLTEEAIRNYFAKGQDGIKELMSRIPA